MGVDRRSKITPHRERRQRYAVACLVLVCAIVQRPFAAFAQSAESSTNPVEQARARYEQGARAYNEARYEDAITHFEAAYAIEPAGALLLNIAQANRLKTPANCQAALRHYELYLAADPRAPERAEVEGHISRMRQCLADASRVAETSTSTTPPPLTTSRPIPRSNTPLWVASAGAVVLIGGGVLYTVARLRFDALQSECPPCSDATIDRWQTITNVSYASMALGGLTSALALAWWRWPSGKGDERQQSAVSMFTAAPTAWISGRNVGLAWHGRF